MRPNILQQSTQETQRETLGKEEKRGTNAEREKDREKDLFSAEGHTRTEKKGRELKDDRRMKDGDKWREKDIAHLFMVLRAIQLEHRSITSSVFITFIKTFMQPAIMNHGVDLI